MESRPQNQYLENRVDAVTQSESSDNNPGDIRRKCLDSYFEPKSFERWKDGRVYEILGVGVYDKLLKSTLQREMRNQWLRLFSELESFKIFTKMTELAHVILGSIFAGVGIYAYCHENYKTALVTGVISNILVNAYPIMLQRYNRVRVQNVLDKRKKRKK